MEKMDSDLGEDEKALLLAAQVFGAKEWASFEELLPDFEDIPAFGENVAGTSIPGINPTKCLMYPTENTTCIMNALWADAPVSTLRAIVTKCKEDPKGRNILATMDEDGYLPLHVAAGASDDLEVVKFLLSSYPRAAMVADSAGMKPVDIIKRHGQLEGRPERKNVGAIREAIEGVMGNYKRLHACYRCGKDDVPLKKCSACKYVSYCGRECQKADWKSHKEVCKQKAAEGAKKKSATTFAVEVPTKSLAI